MLFFLYYIWKYLPRYILEILFIILLRGKFWYKLMNSWKNISMKKVRNNFMKSTGVVRRVDDLGRIVIPKEIRRTLRIRDGEALEIFVDSEMIALKKFSKMSDMIDLAKDLVEIINNNINKTVLITDRDKFIAGAGSLKKKYVDRNISCFLENIMNDRRYIIETAKYPIELLDNVKETLSYVIHPIIMSGDVLGLVLVISDNNDISPMDEKLVNIIAQFLGKHIEE